MRYERSHEPHPAVVLISLTHGLHTQLRAVPSRMGRPEASLLPLFAARHGVVSRDVPFSTVAAT